MHVSQNFVNQRNLQTDQKTLSSGKNLLMSNRFQAAITGKPRSFHCGPEIQRMKLNNNKLTKQDKNPNRRETNQLATYKSCRGVQLRGSNPGACFSKVPTTFWTREASCQTEIRLLSTADL